MMTNLGSMNGLLGRRLMQTTVLLCALAVTAVAATSEDAMPRVEITSPAARAGDALHVWVACKPGTGTGDVQSRATAYAVLGAQPDDPWWSAAPRVHTGIRAGVYRLRARCAVGPGSPYASSTLPFRVSTGAARWTAESTTAQAITGDARFTPESIVFDGGALRIHYLRDVSSRISVLGTGAPQAHAELFAVRSPSDLHLRNGNTLCGRRPTFLTILRTASTLDAEIIVSVYGDARPPKGVPSDALCASYTYAPVAPSALSSNTRRAIATAELAVGQPE